MGYAHYCAYIDLVLDHMMATNVPVARFQYVLKDSAPNWTHLHV